LVNSIQKPRWNFAKANWSEFGKEFDAVVDKIPVCIENYARFVKLLNTIGKKHIPRGFRKRYIPGWNSECDELFNQFKESNDSNIADHLITKLHEQRKNKWIELSEKLDMTHSSRKSWSFMRKVGIANVIKSSNNKVTPNEVATRLIKITKAPLDKNTKKAMKKNVKELFNTLPINSSFSNQFKIDELNDAIKEMKLGKAAGMDGVFMEFIKNLQHKARNWLLKFFNEILNTGLLPREFKRAKIIAIIKPGKQGLHPNEYRPITLLSITYKILERLLLNRIEVFIDEVIPVNQAAFRKNRGCEEQALALSSFIENGFQKKLKTFVCFIDMSSAYDTVWCDRLVYKFMNTIKCKKLSKLLRNMLSNRYFQVNIKEKKSRWRFLNNGLIQGSVLSPILFNLYTNDELDLQCKRFMFADDWALAIQCKTFEEAEKILQDDLRKVDDYFKKCRLIMNPSKTEVCAFHLNNKEANRKLQVIFNSEILHHNFSPKYLGITLDRTLSYKNHLQKLSMKLRTRLNQIQMIAGTNWGASPETLRTSTLALMCGTMNFGCSIWRNSCHLNKVDVQFNNALRVITGTLKPTPLHWLYTLSNIPSPELLRKRSFKNILDKTFMNKNSLLYEILEDTVEQRLISRQVWKDSYAELENFNIELEWKLAWENEHVVNHELILDPTKKVNGFNLDRKSWKNLNRIRTNCGICKYTLWKWNKIENPNCYCGAMQQTISHIICFCPDQFFEGDIFELTEAKTERAINYLKSLNL